MFWGSGACLPACLDTCLVLLKPVSFLLRFSLRRLGCSARLSGRRYDVSPPRRPNSSTGQRRPEFAHPHPVGGGGNAEAAPGVQDPRRKNRVSFKMMLLLDFFYKIHNFLLRLWLHLGLS